MSQRFRTAFPSTIALLSLFLALAWALALGGKAMAQPAQKMQPGSQSPGGTAENYPFVYVTFDSGEMRTVKGNVVPIWPGKSCFGWQLQIGGRNRTVKLTEVLTLAGPAKLWVAGPETKISPDQSTATTTVPAQTDQGLVSRAWCITEGDPPGAYRYDIYIDGIQRGQFTFCAIEMKYDPGLRLEELTCPYKFESAQAPGPLLARALASPPKGL